MTTLLRTIARATTRRPRVAVVALLLVLVGGIAVGTSAGGDLVDDFAVPGIESQQAQDLIAERFPGQGGDSATVVLTAGEGGRLDASGRAGAVESAMQRIASQPHVTAVSDPFAAGRISDDGRTAFATVDYDATGDELGADPRERLEHATEPLRDAGVGVAMSGQIVDAGNEAELPVGELAGVLLAIVLMLVVLRSLRATFASLLTALLGVGLGFALLGLAAAGIDIPSLAPTMAAMLGLGAGIDYALLSAARQQEELRAGRSPRDAAVRTNATAGHSAVTAAAIVLVSISGLLVTGIPFVGKVGVAAGAMVLVTALVAVVLLPPLFAAAGRKMLGRKARRRLAEASADRTASPKRGASVAPASAAAPPPPPSAGFAIRRPARALVLGGAVAVALCIPALGLDLGQPDDGNLPADTTQRQAYDQLAAAFGPGSNGPLVVTVDAAAGGDAGAAARRLREAIAATPDVASVTAPALNPSGDAALLTVFPSTSPQDDRTAALVRDLREQTIPATLDDGGETALVGGYTARLVDEAQRIGDRLPLFAIVVVGLSLVLLAITFRSLKVAALSAVFNLISIAGSFGVVHLLFQTQAGADLIGVDVQPVVAYTPLFMFAILFGLSTDYNVFLLSRVREEWLRRGGHVASAVAEASARTRWTITAAGTIMIVVFLGFATNPDSTVKMTGLGLASAILIDVTLVRLLLAPASLTLLGDRLWGRTPAAAPAPAAVERATAV